MKKFVKLFGILALALVFSLALVSCGDDSGSNSGGGGSDAVSGTWTYGSDRLVLSNGSFTVSEGNTEVAKGSYTLSGSTIRMTVNQMTGAYLISQGADGMGLARTTWYTSQTLRTAIINWAVGQGLSRPDAEALYNQELAAEVNAMYGAQTGTVSGNSMTIWGDTYTKQ